MKIFVTGGAGFIGSNFIRYMLNKYPDYKIECIDSLTYAGNMYTLDDIFMRPNFRFIRADIRNKVQMNILFNTFTPDIVINFAAETHVDNSIKNPEIFVDTNATGTSVLLDLCHKYGNIRFHQVSTDEVYGSLPLDRPDLLFTEDTPINPSSPYSASKASADLLTLAFYKTYELPVTISRCSNNYGPYQHPEKLIPLMITKALKDELLPIYGNGENIRDWLYVEDHCKAIDLIIHNGRIGEIYNVGGNGLNEMSNNYIVETICGVLDKPKDLITHVDDRKGHDLRYGINATKIYNELGWVPEKVFAHGIQETIHWYINNMKWIENISKVK